MIDMLRRFFWVLRRELAVAGPGSVSRAQAAAGVGENYFRHLELRLADGRARGFDLGVLLCALEALGVDKGTFFAAVFGWRDPIERLRHQTAALGEPPEVVVRVHRLLAAAGWNLEALPADYLRRLDDHRSDDPRKTLRLIPVALKQVEAGLSPHWTTLPLLATWGSARRLAAESPRALDEAQQALMAAWELTEQLAEPWAAQAIFGDLLQRLAAVTADRGHHRRALLLSDLAIVKQTTACDRRGVRRSMVDRGAWLYGLGGRAESPEIGI